MPYIHFTDKIIDTVKKNLIPMGQLSLIQVLWSIISNCKEINTLRPRQNGRHFADDIFKCIFLNENAWISLMISLKFVPKVQINNIPALV